MASKQNIIYVYFKGKHLTISKSQYQYNHGQFLYFADLNLPQAFEVHFSNKDKGESKTQIGSDNLVEIPDEYFWNGALQIYAWIYLHSKTTDGETIYEVRIPLTKRAKPTDEEPLPVQQSTIDRAIAELNNAVDITTENANKTDSDKIIVSNIKEDVITLKENIDSTATTINQKAQETINASERAETSAQNAATSENKALNYSQQAEQSAQSALESKNIAQQKSEVATNASSEALGYRNEAQEAKNQAVQAKQNIVDYRDETKGYRDETLNLKNTVQTLKNQADETAEEIKDISDTVKEDAQSASQSASSASQSSTNASQFASQAKKSADDAKELANQVEQNKNQTETFKNQSEEYKTQAETFKSQAETFKNQAEEFKNQTETNVTHYPKIIGEYWYIWDATNGEYINTNVDANGIKGDTGNGIASVALNDDYTLTITFTDDTTYTTSSIRGQQGEKGDTGATGESGVYIGTEEPENEDIKVWIDTDESADSGTVEDLIADITELKEDLSEFSGYINYALADGRFYATNGQTVNIDAPSTNSGWKSCVIECAEGDSFHVTGQSGSSPRLWCFVDASNSRTSAVVLSVAVASKTGDNLLITAPENTTHLVCNFIATQPAKLTQGQTLPEAVNTLESEISNAVSVANGVFVTNVPELACILDANIYVTGYDKVAINYFWYNSPQHTAYETYINLKGYKNGAWENIIGAFSRATAPDNRPNIERVVVDGVFDLVINWSLISNPFTSTYNDTNRPVFKNTCLAIDYSETPQIAPFEEQDTIKNIIVVDASGNGDYTTLTDAYASIKDSDLNNQYEIVVAEGTYQEQYLIPPPYTHTHGIKAETTIITSVGLSYYDAINDWASVFQMMNTCKLSNLTVISGTKYCIHEDDYSLSGKMVKCENVIFHQTKAHNNAVVGNGTQFYGTKYIFNNCTFINGSFTNHSNTRLQKGANQHTILNGCKFVDAVITLSAVPTSADGEKGLYLFDINGCSFNPTQNTLIMRFGEPITGSAKLNYPWMVGGFGNDGININFDNANDTRFTDAWDSVNLSNKTFVKATENITKGDHVTANGAITTASDYYGTALSNGNTGDYVPIWKQ